MNNRTRTKLLGDYGEKIAETLLANAGFTDIRDLNRVRVNHPFGDYYAKRKGVGYLISVRTRNKFQRSGKLNPSYNFRKKAADIEKLVTEYNAEAAWVAIQIDIETRTYCAYFGTMDELNASGERYSIPMTDSATARYLCLAESQHDPEIKLDWSNKSSA